MNKMTENNCRIRYPISQAWTLIKAFQYFIHSHGIVIISMLFKYNGIRLIIFHIDLKVQEH